MIEISIEAELKLRETDQEVKEAWEHYAELMVLCDTSSYTQTILFQGAEFMVVDSENLHKDYPMIGDAWNIYHSLIESKDKNKQVQEKS